MPKGMNQGELNLGEMNPEILMSEEMNPEILIPEELMVEGMNQGELNPGEMNPEILNPEDLMVEGMNPGELNPGEMNPEELTPGILISEKMIQTAEKSEIEKPDLILSEVLMKTELNRGEFQQSHQMSPEDNQLKEGMMRKVEGNTEILREGLIQMISEII